MITFGAYNMKHLANNALRRENLLKLLSALHIPLEGIALDCFDEVSIFHSDSVQGATKLKVALVPLLNLPIKRFASLVDVMRQEVIEGSIGNDDNKKACLALIDIIALRPLTSSLDFDEQTLNVPLPTYAFEALFAAVRFRHMHAEHGQIKINIKALMKTHQDSLVYIEGESPTLLVHESAFAKKKVFYAEKRIDNNHTEVTPYFFVPSAIEPPLYHFILDTSSSMEYNMQALKKSVIAVAEALFDFQPEANIRLTVFSDRTQLMGTFHKDSTWEFINAVNSLKANGGTRLYGTVVDALHALSEKNLAHNNILLFTDGENSVFSCYAKTTELDIRIVLHHLQKQSHLTMVRNKFFILSYNTVQPAIMHDVTKAFSSPVIETATLDFQTALSDKGKLQEWAAKRELFTCRLTTRAKASTETRSVEEVFACDMSGQFVALQPKICKNNDTLEIKILDGANTVLLEDARSFGASSPVSSVVAQSMFHESSQGSQSSTDTQVLSNIL